MIFFLINFHRTFIKYTCFSINKFFNFVYKLNFIVQKSSRFSLTNICLCLSDTYQLDKK